MQNTCKIYLNQVTKKFKDDDYILKDITTCFDQGKSYVITGVSGVGKSTLLHCIAGLESISSGNIFYNNKDISFISLQQRAAFIGLVFQTPHMIQELNVVENVALAARIMGIPSKESIIFSTDLLEKVGLATKLHAHVKELSGGQQQRVSLARALVHRPAFLLADEPTGNLDNATSEQITNLLVSLCKEYGMGLIICSHDAQIIERMQVVFTLKDGILSDRLFGSSQERIEYESST